MEIEEVKATITLNKSEIWELAFSLRRCLIKSIEDHYNCLQQQKDGESVFFSQEKIKLSLLEKLSGLVDLREAHFIEEIKSSFKKKREERERNKKQ